MDTRIIFAVLIGLMILLILENMWRSFRTSWYLANWHYEYAKRGYKDDFITVKEEAKGNE